MQVTFGIDYYMQCIILFMIMVVVMTKMLIQTILFEVKLKKKLGAPILNLIQYLLLTTSQKTSILKTLKSSKSLKYSFSDSFIFINIKQVFKIRTRFLTRC